MRPMVRDMGSGDIRRNVKLHVLTGEILRLALCFSIRH